MTAILPYFGQNRSKRLTKNLFFNIKLLFQHREENTKVFLLELKNYNQFLVTFLKTHTHSQEELEKIGEFFQVAIQFHPSHLQPNIVNIVSVL